MRTIDKERAGRAVLFAKAAMVTLKSRNIKEHGNAAAVLAATLTEFLHANGIDHKV